MSEKKGHWCIIELNWISLQLGQLYCRKYYELHACFNACIMDRIDPRYVTQKKKFQNILFSKKIINFVVECKENMLMI